MNCKNHREAEAKFICDRCKQPICESCAVEVRGNKVCSGCIDQAVYAERDYVERRSFWSKLAFFILACMPGAAHMQLSFFKRGMQLMLTFIGSIVLLGYANIDSFIPMIIIPTWFFSFFDAYNVRKRLMSGEFVEDTEVYNYQFLLQNKKFLGIALLVFGFIGLLNAIDRSFYIETSILGVRINELYWAMKRALIPVLLILSGAFILSRTKKNLELAEQESLGE